MKRRELLQGIGASALLAFSKKSFANGETDVQPVRGMASPVIKDISVIECQPAGVRLTMVKVTTDQAGLFGYGCATFTQRADLIRPAVEKYLKPLLLGRPADRIEDTWQLCYDSSYWKNGPVLNNAISGVDQALWDIKGKQAGLPVYQLVGGKCREAVDTYGHADGQEIVDTIASAKKYMAEGFRTVRVQVGLPGMAAYGSAAGASTRYKPLHDKPFFEPEYNMRRAVKMLHECRAALGEEVGLLHDVHERRRRTRRWSSAKR